MQIDELILYNHEGETRPIPLNAGRLNIITGDSRTGKSSIINTLRFLLGSGSPHAPHGPIQQSIAWYGLRGHVEQTPFFIGRPAPAPDTETSETMLSIGDGAAPAFEELSANTTSDALRGYLGGLIGIADNRNIPAVGQTRHALAATFVHSLHYCFQGQGEIANPDILFHRQNREWMPQTIRDTLPYFLGAQGTDDLRKREELTQCRRDLRRVQQRVRAAESERTAGLDRAGSLIAEARDVGLASATEQPGDLGQARGVLRAVLDTPNAAAVEIGGEFERLRGRRGEINNALRDIAEQLRGLEDFASAEHDYGAELHEQHARLASIGLIPGESAGAACVLCGQTLGAEASPAREAVVRSLERAERRVELAQRDRPLIAQARESILERRQALRDALREVDQALEALAAQEEAVAGARDAINVQSYVRGRIAQYLDSSQDTGDQELERLRAELASLEAHVNELAERLDAEALRSRTTSLLRTVSRQMTDWARQLDLEHSADGAQIDIDRLTIVADTDQGPAYMDRGEIGSGMNWVGYHLTAHLALQDFFIRNTRPVPHFLVLDQPSQAFFPRDRELGGDLDELTDTDREHTRQLYELVHQVVSGLDGRLQVIALDHADFEDDWFAESVVQRWRDGEALIPKPWRTPGEDAPAPRA
ncbi:MAG TPA: DUF3732 domain-containing protein [Solirubrobacteraceae bacterium]|jgi:hypothetical protein|nr:DUF3732 domain-containing protein [Solirubrobacteraceae bacterium]